MDKADNRRARPPVLAIVLLLIVALLGVFFVRAEAQLAELKRSQAVIGLPDGGTAAPGEEQLHPTEESAPPEQEVSLDKNEIPFAANIKVTRSGGINRCAGTVSTYYQKELLSKVAGASGAADAVDVRQVLVTHEYVVEPDDTLEKIARKVYGQTANWQLIYRANRRDISDPGLILPAMTLRIPEPADDQQ